MRAMELLKRAGIDALAWFAAPSIFLFFYVRYHAVSSEAIGPHLYLVLVALSGLTLFRLVICRLIRHRGIAHVIIATTIAAVMIVMLIYYGLVLIGLGAWARVISLDLITSYAVQLPGLMDSIGISVYLAVALFSVAFAMLAYISYRYVNRFDWVSFAVSNTSARLYALIVVSGAAACTIAVYHFFLSPPVQKSEPLSLTFFPLATSRTFQGHSIDNMSAERLDHIEDEARATYPAVGEAATKRNLILIVVDALRPDHMDVYGYKRKTTPNLSRLVQQGRAHVVKNVRSSCGESSCGLLSLASSKYIHQFSNKPFTLQQALRRQGYRIRMILGGDHANFYGLREMYGDVDSYFDGSMAPGYYVNDDQLVLDHVKQLAPWDNTPVMMQFHLMSTHIMGKRHDRFAQYAPSESYILPASRSAGNVDKLVNFYDNGVVQADAYIHDLLASLQNKGYLQDALVVITADHGEALGEHGLFAHANSVREPVLAIPLIFISYRGTGGMPFEPRPAVAQVDIAPTILTELGFPVPRTWSGIPLQAREPGRYSYFLEGQAAGVIDHRDPENVWKYWFDAKTGSEFAYNLTRDPAENINLVDRVDTRLKRGWRLEQVQLMPGIREMPDQ